MSFDLTEAVHYYKRQGAPADQSALVSLLREVQSEHGGSIPRRLIGALAAGLSVKESFLLALIRRFPSLHLAGTHCLELCAGPNCSRKADLATVAEEVLRAQPGSFELKFVPCMRQCAKGPNLRWDGTLYSAADEALLRHLLAESK